MVCRGGGAIVIIAVMAIWVGLCWSRAAVVESWVQRYSLELNDRHPDDRAVKIVRDTRGDVIVVGVTDNGIRGGEAVIIKYAGTDGTRLWEKRHDCPQDREDVPMDLVVERDGNVVLVGGIRNGVRTDYYLAKYSGQDGSLIWERKESGEVNTSEAPRMLGVDSGGDLIVTTGSYRTTKYSAVDGARIWEHAKDNAVARDVVIDRRDNVIVTGSSGVGGSDDYYTAKYSGVDGRLLWEKRYNGLGDGFDVATGVAVDAGDDVVVTGGTSNGAGVESYTIKYASADGATIWERRNESSAFPARGVGAKGVEIDRNGDVVVSGRSGGGVQVVKYRASDGVMIWETTGGDDGNGGMVLDGKGNLIVAGRGVFKYSAADGRRVWEAVYEGLNGLVLVREFRSVVVDASGDLLATGYDQRDLNSQADFYTAKYSGVDGRLIWEKRFDAPGPTNGHDGASAVVVDPVGDVVVTGDSSNGTNSDIYTANYSGFSGALIWEKRFNGPGTGEDLAKSLAVDSRGHVIVMGISAGTYYTAKYASADGKLIWEKIYRGPYMSYDEATAMALDPSGNVIVTGWSYNTSGSPDVYTLKYAAADGAVLWARRYTSTASVFSHARAVAVDRGGNVVVTGDSHSGTNLDFYTAKYAAKDGALMWERRYNGPANDGDLARAVAVDASGNAVVTGFSGNGVGTDYYTAKYAASDGSLLWEKRYRDPGVGVDYAGGRTVAIDDRGDVVVAGVTGGDFGTIKYAAQDGAVIWEKRHDGPSKGLESVDYSESCLALGPNGMVVIAGASDGNVGPASTLDYATVVYRETVPSAVLDVVTGGVRLRFAVVPGEDYRLERALRVEGPWAVIAAGRGLASGLVEYVDTSTLHEMGFYRMLTRR